MNVVDTFQLRKSYDHEGPASAALSDISLSVKPGEFVVLRGPSGSGKTTLLNCMGLADRPDAGSVMLCGQLVDFRNERQLVALRRTRLGYIFQRFNLVAAFTVLENVAFPLLLQGKPRSSSHQAGLEALARLGLEGKARRFPYELSGGEMQRVAVARATIHSPSLVLADEPTGSLDSTNGRIVLDLLTEVRSRGAAVVMATHSDEAARYGDRVVSILDGRLENFL